LRIAIDASRITAAQVTGTERYALEMIRALLTLPHDHAITLYFRDPPAPDLLPMHNAEIRVIPFARAWTHTRFAAQIAQDKPDITWVPAHTLPALIAGKTAVTVHDLGYKYFPEAHPTAQRAYLDWSTRHSASRADVIFADSRATAADLTRFYGTSPDKIRVIYPGADAPVIGDIRAAKAKYGLPDRYFLFLGTLQPRKNIARLVQAYSAYRARTPDPCALVLAGAKGWLFDPAWIADADGVIVTGYIDDDARGALYAGSRGFVFPSLFEGFGFPVLEAMLCGVPVLCSSTSSLPELAGDAAITVDPLEISAIAAAMHTLDTDDSTRQRLIAAGKIQAARFNWRESAAHALSALETAARS
jgi:glycosyltransferase involved in cell wall biosynthesis